MKQLDDGKYTRMLSRILDSILNKKIAWEDVVEKFNNAETKILSKYKDHYWIQKNSMWYVKSKPSFKYRAAGPTPGAFDYEHALRVIIEDIIDSDMSWQDMLAYFDKLEKNIKSKRIWVKSGEKYYYQSVELPLDGFGEEDLTDAELQLVAEFEKKWTKPVIFEMFRHMAMWYQGNQKQRLNAGNELVKRFKPILNSVMDLDITHDLYRGISVKSTKYPALANAKVGQTLTLINFGCSSWTYEKKIARRFIGEHDLSLIFKLESKAIPILVPPPKTFRWFDIVYADWQRTKGSNYRTDEKEYVLINPKLKVTIVHKELAEY